MRAALAAFLVLAAPVSAQSELSVDGVQFRFIWPATGALSDDVFSVPALNGESLSVFCGEAQFPGGESYRDLGTALDGVLLIAVRARDGFDGSFAAGDVSLSGPALTAPVTRRIGAPIAETAWHAIAILPTNLSFRRYAVVLDGSPVPLPDWSSNCRG